MMKKGVVYEAKIYLEDTVSVHIELLVKLKEFTYERSEILG